MKSSAGAGLRSLEGSPQNAMQTGISFGRKLLFVGSFALALSITSEAFAKGGVAAVGGNVGGVAGTAKPPAKNLVSSFPVSPLPVPLKAVTDACVGIGGCAIGAGLTGFDVTGFIQSATVAADNTMCPNTPNQDATRKAAGLPNLLGGTAKINGVTITVPCNTVVQMPANTVSWADFVNSALPAEYDATGALKGFKTTGSGSPQQYELRVVGNTVGTDNRAALIYISQQTTNAGSGIVKSIDYKTGRMLVDNGLGKTMIVAINDPLGRFGRPTSPDVRFSVDDQNPTVHAGTGYPMCIPRSLTDPALTNKVPGPDDPLCPQKNRPLAKNGCRNFTAAGLLVLPKSGELPAPVAADVFCKAYVMPPVTASAGIAGLVSAQGARALTAPDARQQAPIEAGDFINFSGTLFPLGDGTDYISAHTIEVNVGIHTQPGTAPSYVAIGEFGLGPVDPPPAPAVGLPINFNGVAAEFSSRIFLEASTTDVVTPVDIYYMDAQLDGTIHNRWVTPFNMTGECDPAPAVAPAGGVLGGNCFGTQGGISTQYTGPQNMRARIRAIKPPALLLNQPGRYVRVVSRTMCLPTQKLMVDANNIPVFTPNGDQAIDTSAQDACIQNAPVMANGITAGTYFAPVFEYIFPENTQVGQPIIPNDFWDLPFLVNGEGPTALGKVGPLEPVPW